MRPPVPPERPDEREDGAGSGRVPDRRLVVVMGVSGVGKTAVGEALAARLGVAYADADDFHTPASVAKMSAGTPLTDDDRLPWLQRVGHWLRGQGSTGGVVSCSALRRGYRQVIREEAPTACFLHLSADEEVLRARMTGRQHFMPPSLLTSQLQTLEPLAEDEPGVEVDAAQPVADVVEEYLRRS